MSLRHHRDDGLEARAAVVVRHGANITIREVDLGLRDHNAGYQEFEVEIRMKSGMDRLLRIQAVYCPDVEEHMTHRMRVELFYRKPDGTRARPMAPWVRGMNIDVNINQDPDLIPAIAKTVDRWYNGSMARLLFRHLEPLATENMMKSVS